MNYIKDYVPTYDVIAKLINGHTSKIRMGELRIIPKYLPYDSVYSIHT